MPAHRSLAALMALVCITSATAVPLYNRPINEDCIQMGGSSDGVQLYPTQFMVVGDKSVTDEFTTEVVSARGFTVTYYPTYKVVNNTIAGELYVLFQCGASAPPTDDFPEGTKFFKVPLTSVSAPETVPYAFMDLLGLGDRVHDVSPYVTSPCGQALLACPTASRASPDFMVLSNDTALEEAIGGYVDGMLVSEPYTFPASFVISAAQDPGALNRAEWVKFLGLFFNREREASQVFEGIKAEYEATKEAAQAAAKDAQPVVAWAQHFEYPGLGESYQLSFDPYQAQLTEDAGAAMLDREAIAATPGVQTTTDSPTVAFTWGQPGTFASEEEAKAAFIAAISKADVIIDETYAMDPTAYTPDQLLATWNMSADELAGVPAWANRKVYREDGLLGFDPATGSYGMDWFEGALTRPGQVIRDLVRTVHPQALQEAQNFTWMRNLFTEEPTVVGAQDCTAASACTAEPATICPFVKLCGEGQAPAILQSDGAVGDDSCTYAACGAPSALGPAAATNAGSASGAAAPSPTNAAAMAAPAVVLTLVVVAFVEILMHFC